MSRNSVGRSFSWHVGEIFILALLGLALFVVVSAFRSGISNLQEKWISAQLAPAVVDVQPVYEGYKTPPATMLAAYLRHDDYFRRLHTVVVADESMSLLAKKDYDDFNLATVSYVDSEVEGSVTVPRFRRPEKWSAQEWAEHDLLLARANGTEQMLQRACQDYESRARDLEIAYEVYSVAPCPGFSRQ